MTKEAIFERISVMLKEQLNQDDLEISLETDLQDELGVDSIALMEFIISLEDEYHLDIPDEEVENMESLGQMVDYLYQKLA
ncbi:acyl carrier protein [Streptococcus ferus]|uniref:Acyl carrier protein n=1 Tax=Streptococcus ferus TaxID=1345 RepID=A0A2X3W3B6_9STRE|nr:acyl carrier protein [Streptococcus ferus]SQF38063.1 acyl carrier protein [Streptococcus ferus]